MILDLSLDEVNL